MESVFKNKSILVTGACGSVGSELISQILTNPDYEPREIIGIDNNETQIFFLDQKYLSYSNASFFVMDIRDLDSLSRMMAGVDVVFHCAALKHVVLCERSPEQALQTNIQGTQNVISAAQASRVSKVIFTSSDKAVNPTNVMGTSKLMGERLVTAANNDKYGRGTLFASTRFGNILGSNGSVVPIFHNQISKGGPVTLTNRDMTRFVMSNEDAAKLVLESVLIAKGGEVFVTKMPVVRIEDLAKALIEELAPRYGYSPKDIKITEIGIKPGEKLYEELMSSEETRRAYELQNYFSVLPAFRSIYQDIYEYSDLVNTTVSAPYVSSNETSLTVTEIRMLLSEYKLLGAPEESSLKRYWPGDKELKNK